MMTEGPLVSIGVPVRNGGELIGEALELLVNQTYRNIEIIISNNNSNDQTEEICTRLQAQDKRIKYYRQDKDLNVLENFRFVVDHSLGAYFMWAAHDDRRSLNYVEVLLAKMLQEPNASIVFSDVAKFTDFKEWMHSRIVDYEFECYKSESYLSKIMSKSYTKSGCLHIYGLIFRKFLSEYTWPRIEIAPDKPLLYYLACRGDFVRAKRACIYMYKPIKEKALRVKECFYQEVGKHSRLRLYWICAKVGCYAEALEGRHKSFPVSFLYFIFEEKKSKFLRRMNKRMKMVLRLFKKTNEA
jgi:glycosyltransferase involved in cell wall biosynthesis